MSNLLDQFRDVIDTAVKFKKVMQKKGIKRARCVCPRCGSFIHGCLSGPRNHLRMTCEGKCGMNMME